MVQSISPTRMSELLFGTLLLSSSPATSLATVTGVPVISHGRNIITGSYLFRIGFAILNRFLQILLQILHMLAIYFILLWVKSALTEKQLKKKKKNRVLPRLCLLWIKMLWTLGFAVWGQVSVLLGLCPWVRWESTALFAWGVEN